MEIKRKDRFIIYKNNAFKVVLSSLGASIVEISINDDVLTMTPANYEDLNRKDIYYGKTIGPIVNRIKDGLFKVDEKEYRFPCNEENISNHSGSLGLSNKLFVSTIQGNKVIFTHQQKIGDVNISYGIMYTFSDGYQIKVDYIVRASDKFVMNLTNHTFFTLGESSIDKLSLQIPSDKFIESDKDTLLPLRYKDIIDCLNFNNGKLISKDINDSYLQDHKSKGYDHSYILKDNKAILKSPKYELTIESNYPNIHIYSDNYEDNVKIKTSSLTKNRGIAIEPTDDLLDRPIINKEDTYQRQIIYTFRLNDGEK